MNFFYFPLILVLQNLLLCKGGMQNATELDPTMMQMYDQEIEATFGEQNIGQNYFEGDIRLTQQQRDYIEESWHSSNAETRALVRDTRKLWTEKVVPYVLADALNDETRGYIESAISEWEEKTCVRFKEREAGDHDYIEFVYEVGCSSYVGCIGGRQTISVGSAGLMDGAPPAVLCKHGNIVHEIAHSLGFFHEHSRPDRDDYVEIQWDKIESGYEKNFRKESLDTVDSRNVGYDYASVMHYGAFFFTKEQGLKTIQCKQAGASIGQRIGLSVKDAQQGNLLYECSGYGDKATNSNTTTVGSFDQELWDGQRPLHDREVKVLRSKVQKHKKHHQLKQKKDELSAHGKQKKAGILKGILKSKKASKKSTPHHAHKSTEHENRVIGKSRSTVLNGNELKPLVGKDLGIKDDADILEGDDEEDDMPPSSRGVAVNTEVRASPTQLATDRATLAQEEEDAMQQQDNDEIGEENLGKGYFEGDMILTPEQRSFLDQMKDDGSGTQKGAKRALIKDKMYLWPHAKVYYDFHKGVDRIGRRRARVAMKHWQKHTCLKFKRVKKPPKGLGYIKFVFEGGCASRVGRGGSKMQKLTIGSPALRCKVGNIIHEMGHAVGFFHEHSRPDRNKYVRVLKKNILPGYERNFYRFSKKWIDSRDVPYDYDSIMHYNRAFFSRFPVMLETVVPLGRNVEIGQRKALSKFDVLQANLLYQCDGRKRLTDEEIQQLKEESDDQLNGFSCADVYDQNSCQSVRTMGYCEKFPITMRTTCGITCNLCAMAGHKKAAVNSPSKEKHAGKSIHSGDANSK